jgi:hypothetical protein
MKLDTFWKFFLWVTLVILIWKVFKWLMIGLLTLSVTGLEMAKAHYDAKEKEAAHV